MLILVKKMSGLSFSRLMEIYAEGNEENGRELWPNLTDNERILRAEQAFYEYLNEDFFKTEGAVYAIWQENGSYISALRLEPYQDGMLLEALETAPEHRHKGYAAKLIRAVLEWVGNQKVYSHVSKRNAAMALSWSIKSTEITPTR